MILDSSSTILMFLLPYNPCLCFAPPGLACWLWCRESCSICVCHDDVMMNVLHFFQYSQALNESVLCTVLIYDAFFLEIHSCYLLSYINKN